jgi:alanyl-tRNA synthetase
VAQKGSLNAPDRLRFDISHHAPISPEDLRHVEREVNARIRENSEVTTRLMTPEAAVAEGAMALFGEKYGDEVRVVSMGGGEGNRSAWSIELCGGTHVARTGDIGAFRIMAESGVSAGVRRIEAVAAAAAIAAAEADEDRLGAIASALRTSPTDAAERVTALLEERRRLERQVAELQRKLAAGEGGGGAVEETKSGRLVARNLGEVAPGELKGLAETIRQQNDADVVTLISTANGKANIVVHVGGKAAGHISAVDLVRLASAAVGGKGGGGRPDMAQAGGPDAEAADAALAAVRMALSA